MGLTFNQAIDIAEKFGISPVGPPPAPAPATTIPASGAQAKSSTTPLSTPSQTANTTNGKSEANGPKASTPAPKSHSSDEIRTWLNDVLRKECSPAEIASAVLNEVKWDRYGTSVTLHFMERPHEAVKKVLERHVDWLSNMDRHSEITTELDYHYPTARIAISAVRCADQAGRAITIPQIFSKIRAASTHNEHFLKYLLPPTRPPRPFWRYKGGGSGKLVVSIQDTYSGDHARLATSKKILIDNEWYSIHIDRPDKVNPYCTNCKRWRHSASQCKAGVQCCERCGGLHLTDLHNRLSFCCAEERERLQAEVVECPPKHDFCPNCGKYGHRASSTTCPYYINRHNEKWLCDPKHAPAFPVGKLRAMNRYQGYRPRKPNTSASLVEETVSQPNPAPSGEAIEGDDTMEDGTATTSGGDIQESEPVERDSDSELFDTDSDMLASESGSAYPLPPEDE
ncbi:hypothetical protein K474DRAFT_1710724 [Panus rudis PR-1116 ss-1]|nr:hypothetical protein K474DRAFT_1710724 [Panus rudis PR-1116 ss-1]